AQATDLLAMVMTDLGSIAERRIARLIDPVMSYGLPRNLASGTPGLNTGYAPVQCSMSALVMENRSLSTPGSVDTIPGKGNAEDHVSNSMWCAQKAAQDAQRAMKKARESLKKQNGAQAEQEQKEAEEKLQEAEDQLQEELNQYVSSQQEQMLVQVEENLKAMRKLQLTVNDDTIKIDIDQRKRGSWNNALRRRVKRRSGKCLYNDQEQVKKTADETVEALGTGQYGGFTRNMRLIQSLLNDIMGNLDGRSPDVGEGTQMDQLEIIGKLDRMLDAVEGERKRLAKEREKNEEEQQEGGGGQGQPQPEPLVSKLAEMELVYAEQKALGSKVRNLNERTEGMTRDELPDYYKRLYERYAKEQAELKAVWDDLRKQIEG
ncbi:MAG: aromatic amino acid ammonia-lyase, partial [Planctomycetes bacterium]|nr:aromatic amino acid ammonia-lyase [Planctomycetota bacterium]